MTILIAVLATAYFCISVVILILDDFLSPLAERFGLKPTPGWKKLLSAFGWPVVGILNLLRTIATKVVNFLKWLK